MASRKYTLVALLRKLLSRGDSQTSGLRGFVRMAVQKYLRWNRELLLDPWLRYRIVVAILVKAKLGHQARILDVGSGSVGLAYFLKSRVIAADLEFSNAEMAAFRAPIDPVRASATHLPFKDSSFQAVVSMDMLEHLGPSVRASAIHELCRVSGSLLILGFPFGERSAQHDRLALAEETFRGIALGWREEHVRHGLPDQQLHDQIVKLVDSAVPKRSLTWFGHESLSGLRLRWKLQLLIGSDSRLRGLLVTPLYWLHARGHRRRGYRRVYVIRNTEPHNR